MLTLAKAVATFDPGDFTDAVPRPVFEVISRSGPVATVNGLSGHVVISGIEGPTGPPGPAGSQGLAGEAAAVVRGPNYGFSSSDPSSLLASVWTDRTSRGVRALRSDGNPLELTPVGNWNMAARRFRGPCAGFAGGEPDSIVIGATLDAAGYMTSARAVGSLWRGVDYIASPLGLARREVHNDLAPLSRSGTVIAIPPVRLKTPSGWLYTQQASVTSALPASAGVTGEIVSMRYQDAGWLAYQYARAVAVTRVSDSLVLTEGTHYSVDLDRGVLTGLVNTADFNVSVNYTGHRIRADLVSVDPQNLAMTVTAGTERLRVASMFEPALPAGHQALFRLFRTVDTVELTPLFQFRTDVRLERADEIEADLALQRRRARKHRILIEKKTRLAQTLKWCGEGDSITAMGGGTAVEMNGAPNQGRDVAGYFDRYDSAARAPIPVYDFSDGRGATHVKEGWNWTALAWLEASHGIATNYRNWGIGGTSSINTLSNGFYNQGHASKIANIIADTPDIVCYAPGMNELGASYTYANVKAICESYLAAGILMILVQPVRPNTRFRNRIMEWRETCRQIAQVADTLGIPLVSTARLFDPINLGGLGLAENELCEATMQNHPGRKELNAVGRLITELF